MSKSKGTCAIYVDKYRGVATFLKAPESLEELITAADSAMYEGKKAGKNLIIYKTL